MMSTAALSRADHDCKVHLPIVTGTCFHLYLHLYLANVCNPVSTPSKKGQRKDYLVQIGGTSSRADWRNGAAWSMTGRIATSGCFEDSKK